MPTQRSWTGVAATAGTISGCGAGRGGSAPRHLPRLSRPQRLRRHWPILTAHWNDEPHPLAATERGTARVSGPETRVDLGRSPRKGETVRHVLPQRL
jgi:hypothetical protein